MSEDKREAAAAEAGEPFLERWSRRKRQAGSGDGQPEEHAPPAVAKAAAQDAEQEPAAAPELPDIDSLDENSDYSAFLAPGVDESLRQRALRKLFRSPKFNVCDGLDDYCEDFTKFEKLGDILTADMRFHLERAARKLEQLADSAEPSTPRPAAEEAPAAPDDAHADDGRPDPA